MAAVGLTGTVDEITTPVVTPVAPGNARSKTTPIKDDPDQRRPRSKTTPIKDDPDQRRLVVEADVQVVVVALIAEHVDIGSGTVAEPG